MLRTNLATRPFYNDRAVRVGIAGVVLVVAALTTYNVMQVVALNARSAEMTARAQNAERQRSEYARQAESIRQSLNTAEMSAVQHAAQEANVLIGRRIFSWTDLFNQFERTLPAEVRIVAVDPQVDDEGRMLIAVTVLSRRPEDLSEFMDQLEMSGRFREMLNRQDSVTDDGLTRSILQGYYEPPSSGPASAPPPASDKGGPAANQSPASNGAPRTPEAAR
jgi:hypothetical protein